MSDNYFFDSKKYTMEKKDNQFVFYSNYYKKWFRVGETAKDILMSLDGNKNIEEVSREISKEYDIPYEQVFSDTEKFCEDAFEKGYIFTDLGQTEIKEKKQHLQNLYINVTKRCNFKCKYCNTAHNKNEIIDLKQLKQYIVRLIDEEIIKYTTINITGGEPLLYQDLEELLRFFNERSLSCVVWTNGYYLNENNISWLKEFCTYLIFPLDSKDEVTNDNIRDTGSFYAATKAAKLCRAHGMEFMCSFTPTKDTYVDMQELSLFVESLGAISLLINEPIRETYTGSLINGFDYDEGDFIKKYAEVLDRIALIRSWKNYNSSEKVFSVQRTKEVCLNNIYYIKDKSGCGMCKNELLIDSDGMLYPCHMLYAEHLCCGDIQSGINEKLPEIVQNENDCVACQTCEMKFLCLGDCKAYKYYRNHSMQPVESKCIEIREKLLKNMFGIFE